MPISGPLRATLRRGESLLICSVSIPKRFTEVSTWKGKVDGEFLEGLKSPKGQSILNLAEDQDQ